jgi:hypothetical protein
MAQARSFLSLPCCSQNTLPAFAQNGTDFDPDVVDAFVRIAPSLATVGR